MSRKESFGKRQGRTSPAVSALEIPTNRPIVDVTIPGIGIVKAMVDSGANACVIRHSVIASINHFIIPVFNSENGGRTLCRNYRRIRAEGRMEVKKKRKEKEKITVLVLMELSHDVLLGADRINQIVGIAIHPSIHQQVQYVIIEPFTDHSSCSEENVASFSCTCQST
jgi:hypothetical protein